MAKPGYRWSDSWLLLAVLWAARDGAASLSAIIGAGDAINHALFTPAELNGGLARLIDGGLVVEDQGCFRPTESVCRTYETWACRDTRQQSEAVAAFPGAEDDLSVESAGAPPWAPTREVVSSQEIGEAERQYFARVRK